MLRIVPALLLVACGSGDGSSGVLTITGYSGDVVAPIPFLAGQDGDGEWVALESEDGIYELATGGRYGIAYSCGTSVWFVFATLDEHDHLARVCDGDLGAAQGTFEVTVQGLEPNDLVTVQTVAGEGVSVTSDAPTATSSPLPAPRTWDLVAVRFGMSELAIARGVGIEAGATTSVDIDMTEAFATDVHEIELEGAIIDSNVLFGHSFVTRDGGGFQQQPVSRTDTPTYRAVPPEHLQPDDMHQVVAQRFGPDGDFRSSRIWTHTGKNVTLRIPPAIPRLNASVYSTEPYLRPTIELYLPADASMIKLVYGAITFTASAGWVGSEAVEWTAPDLSGLEGWRPDWVQGEEPPVSMPTTVMYSDRNLLESGLVGREAWVLTQPFSSAAEDGTFLQVAEGDVVLPP